MRNKGGVSGLIASAMTIGALATALAAAAPDVYHDIKLPTMDRIVSVSGSVTTPDGVTPDVYHDI